MNKLDEYLAWQRNEAFDRMSEVQVARAELANAKAQNDLLREENRLLKQRINSREAKSLGVDLIPKKWARVAPPTH